MWDTHLYGSRDLDDAVLQRKSRHLEYWSGYLLYVDLKQYRLSGEYPFYGENTQQLLKRICN